MTQHFTRAALGPAFAKAIAEEKLLIQHPGAIHPGTGCSNVYKPEHTDLRCNTHCVIGSVLDPELYKAFGFIRQGFEKGVVTAESEELSEQLVRLQYDHDTLIVAAANHLEENLSIPPDWIMERDAFLVRVQREFPNVGA